MVSKYDTSPNRPTEQKELSGHVFNLSYFALLLNPPIFSLPEISATKLEAAVLPSNNNIN
jgi:hypothetical protein